MEVCIRMQSDRPMDKQHNILDTPDTGCQESGDMLTHIIRSRRSIYANDNYRPAHKRRTSAAAKVSWIS